MNEALACMEDTLHNLIGEAQEAHTAAVTARGTSEEAFRLGRAEALVQSLHSWSNQLQTFGLDVQMNGVWGELREFLVSQGY
jgi:hypothetical protein